MDFEATTLEGSYCNFVDIEDDNPLFVFNKNANVSDEWVDPHNLDKN